MTEEDLDRRLRARLGRLADAIPVAEREAVGPERIVRGPVVWARALPGRLAVAVVLVTTLAIAAWAGGSGRFATPGASPSTVPPTGWAEMDVATDGPFELTIRSAMSEYAVDESIDVQASLAYRGTSPGVVIFHGLGASNGPLAFGVVEPVAVPGVGLIQIAGGYRLACRSSTLDPATTLTEPFAKGGGPVVDGPDGPSFEDVQRYFSDRVLRLPPGTWHVYAGADFSLGGCGGERHTLRAEITVVVPAADGSIPTAVPPTATPDPGALPVGDDTQEGPIQLTLTSPHGKYRAGEPIEVTAGLANGGSDGSITTFGSRDGPVAFWLQQLDGSVTMTPATIAECVEQVTLPLYEPVEIPFAKEGSISGGDTDPGFWDTWSSDPVLRLPAGRWEISATPAFSTAADCSMEPPNLRPTITITVTP